MQTLDNANGFTLIEVMIASFVLATGILAMSLMQIKAMDANSSAFSRSAAGAIAVNFLEELKRLPFDDVNLDGVANADLDAGKPAGEGPPTPENAGHHFDPANFSIINYAFNIVGSDIVDSSGRTYQVFWNVDKTPITIGTETFTPYCTIRLFVYWRTPSGRKHMAFTTIKYNNTKKV